MNDNGMSPGVSCSLGKAGSSPHARTKNSELCRVGLDLTGYLCRLKTFHDLHL